MMKHSRRTGLVLAAALLGSAVWAQGDAYPSKPLRLISGFAAGGSSDLIARGIATALQDELRHPVVVDYRAGAAGLLGLDAVTNAKPDGYTIGLLAATTLNSLHFAGKPLDMGNRFVPVGRFASTRILLAVNPKVIDVSSLSELAEHLKRHPGTALTSAGHGGQGHLGLELFALEQGLKILHVPYRGAGPAMTDVLAGQVGGIVSEANFALPHIRSGKLRAIVGLSSERIPSLPDLPTAAELGYKSLRIDSTFGLVLPPRTPQPIVERLRQALRRAVDSAPFSEAMRGAGNARYFQDGPEYAAWLEEESRLWGQVIKRANIAAQ